MATIANPPIGAMPVDDTKSPSDPFLATPSDGLRQRYSDFDNHQSLYSNGSPAQAKRALEAHLAETERRLQEAGRLGGVLLQQQKELAERLRDVNSQQQQDEIAPELKTQLVELEREVNEVSRETARAFIAKNRSANGDVTDTPGASVYSSESQHSPSKVHAPSRKQRNQQPGRVNDLKLATDISTSLLSQVRDLQAAVAEKDEALKLVSLDKSQLEHEFESLRQRLRVVNESEQRFKDENWSLETQLHDLTATSKQVADREQRLTHNIKTTQSEKAALEREFEELKQTHGKLSEDHTTIRKQHEAEIGTLRRNATADETERTTLQKRVEELTSQNKELAQAVAYRLRDQSRNVSAESAFDEDDDDGDRTPEDSPPGSPSKATPRHGHLSSETMASSLAHAHRMIQNLKNQVHREKTEKIEYRRLLQDARDDLEARRAGVDSGKKRKPAKDQDTFKKPSRPDRLGAARDRTDEIIIDDPDWEDHDGPDTPSRPRANIGVGRSANRDSMAGASTEGYVTATETSDAFETANERGENTETDAFQTGAETLDGDSSDDLTEKEDGPTLSNIAVQKRPPPSARFSYQSTASTSGDDEDAHDLRTPVQAQHPKYKLRLGRAASRKVSTRADALEGSPADFRDSPASITSNSSTPAAAGQSLFAELEDMSDDGTEEGTPRSVSSVLSPHSSPLGMRKSPAPSRLRIGESSESKPVMVDTAVMTEPWHPEAKGMLSNATEAIGGALAGGIGFALGRGSKSPKSPKLSTEQSHDKEASTALMDVDAEKVTSPPNHGVVSPVPQETQSLDTVNPLVAAPSLQTSAIVSQHVEPVDAPKASFVPFGHSALLTQYTEPEEPAVFEKAAATPLEHSTVKSLHTEPDHMSSVQPAAPIEEEIVPLSFSTIVQQETEPKNPPRPATAVTTGAMVPTTTMAAPDDGTSADSQTSIGAGFFGSFFGRRKSVGGTTIAEDETSQPPKTPIKQEEAASSLPAGDVATDERTLLSPMDDNVPPLPDRRSTRAHLHNKHTALVCSNESTQTELSGNEIDKLLKGKVPVLVDPSYGRPTASPTNSTFAGITPRRSHSRDSVNTAERIRRPGSSGSMRSRGGPPPPPLPTEARQVIAAASQKAPSITAAPQSGAMGPPAVPASAYKSNQQPFRPRTPVSALPSPSKDRGTMRASVTSTPGGRSDAISPVPTRRSSVSSFASELDHRFNIQRSHMDNRGFNPNNTDPRMVQAITQTMIGEYLWKYTRKAGREEMSSTRHRRFFWCHPYTRTLYWSEIDPAGSASSKAKSVSIEAVRVVTDNNPMPPGIHRKSIVVITPHRSIKFTAPTSQRHETWFNARRKKEMEI